MKFPKSPSAFKRQAEAGFRKANPDAVAAVIEWTFGPKRVEFPTGLKGFSGVFKVECPGFRGRTMVATATTETGLSVR